MRGQRRDDDRGRSDDMQIRNLSGDPEIAYLKAKADYLRRLARGAAAEIFDASETVALLQRLAREFEERAAEIEQDLNAGRPRGT
jgi:hypothetical protein